MDEHRTAAPRKTAEQAAEDDAEREPETDAAHHDDDGGAQDAEPGTHHEHEHEHEHEHDDDAGAGAEGDAARKAIGGAPLGGNTTTETELVADNEVERDTLKMLDPDAPPG